MIYELLDTIIIPGKMSEYSENYVKELVPYYREVGTKVAGSFRALTGNMNEVYHLWVYDNLADIEKSRIIRAKNADFRKAEARLAPFRVSVNRTILEPNAWSPMK
jgi:hypothetical protein